MSAVPAGDFKRAALEFLTENGLPVELLPVAIYEDQQGRRFVDVEGEREPELPVAASAPAKMWTLPAPAEGPTRRRGPSDRLRAGPQGWRHPPLNQDVIVSCRRHGVQRDPIAARVHG